MYFCLFGDRVIVEFWLAGHSLCYVDWAGLELTEIVLFLPSNLECLFCLRLFTCVLYVWTHVSCHRACNRNFSLHHVGAEDRTEVLRLSSRCLIPPAISQVPVSFVRNGLIVLVGLAAISCVPPASFSQVLG